MEKNEKTMYKKGKFSNASIIGGGLQGRDQVYLVLEFGKLKQEQNFAREKSL